MIMPAEGSLQRARSFPKTEPICCPGPSTNLLHQFQCVLHQLSSYQPGHLFLMLLAPVASQLKQILHSVPSPYPDADPRRRRCWKTQSLPCRPSCANPREDGRPRGGSQIYHPAHRTDWRRRIGAGYGGSPPGSATISLPSTPASSPTAVSGTGSSPKTCAWISPVPESGLTQCAAHLS